MKYSKLPANQVEFKDGKMKIIVSKSASPLVYPLDKPTKIKAVEFAGQVTGKIDFKDKTQGEKGADDFLFRLGFVYKGDQKLGFFKRQIAPKWVKRLFALAPKGMGVEMIDFYNVYSQAKLAGKSRTHPLSDLIRETFNIKIEPDGKFQAKVKVPKGKELLALWISSDGDDTKSSFEVEVSKIEFEKRKAN